MTRDSDMTTRRDEIEKIIVENGLYTAGISYDEDAKEDLIERIHASEVAMLKPVREALIQCYQELNRFVAHSESLRIKGQISFPTTGMDMAEKALATLDAIIGEEKNV